MRYFWAIGLIIFCTRGQQPPDERTFQRSQDLSHALNKLRLSYQSSVDTNYAAIQAHIFQKSEESAGISKSHFGGRIEVESDEVILTQLNQMTKHLLDMHKLEEQLKKSKKAQTKDLLELDGQYTTHRQMQELQQKLFETVILLSYHQTIRLHEKAAEIHKKLQMPAKP